MLDLTRRHAGRGHRPALRQAFDGLLEENVVALGQPAVDPGQPHNEPGKSRQQAEHDPADEDMVGTCLHQRIMPLFRCCDQPPRLLRARVVR